MLENKISAMMLASIAITITMVLAVTAWTAAENNRTAAEDSLRMVSGGLQARVERVASLNWDYAAWAAAFENTRAQNVEWLSENMGIGANGTEFHILQLVRPEDWSTLTWTADTNEAGTAPLDTPAVPIDAVQKFIPALQSFERDVQDTQTAYFEIDGTINILTVSRVQPWGKTTDIPPENFPLLVFTLRMDDAFLADLAETYLLEDVVLSSADLPGHIAIPLKGPDGTVLTNFQWLPPCPQECPQARRERGGSRSRRTARHVERLAQPPCVQRISR